MEESPIMIVVPGYTSPLTKAGDLLMNPIKKAYNDNVLNIYKGKAKFLVSSLEGSSAAVLGASAVGWDINE